MYLRYKLTFIGYNAGNKFLQNLAKSNMMDKLTSGASILGLMVIGAMPAMLMSIKTPLNIGTSDSRVAVQGILDQLVPNMLPLALTLLVFLFCKKKYKNNLAFTGDSCSWICRQYFTCVCLMFYLRLNERNWCFTGYFNRQGPYY